MNIICSNIPSTACSSCATKPKYVFLRNMHTDLSVTHWRHREIVEYNLHLFLQKIEAKKKILTCMLNLKTLGQEIKKKKNHSRYF